MDQAKNLKERVKVDCKKRVITQEELTNISKKFNQNYSWNLGNYEIDLEKILYRCKKERQGEKYILTPEEENDSNPAHITPFEEFALMKLFSPSDFQYSEVIVLLGNERVKIELKNKRCFNEKSTIDLLFETIQDKSDIQKQMVK